MESGAGEVGRNPPELDRRAKERPTQRITVGIEEGRSTGRVESHGRQAISADGELAGDYAAEPGSTIRRDQTLAQHHVVVARLDVAGKVHLPGKYVRQIPGQAHSVAGIQLCIGDLSVECFVQRIVDLAFETDGFRPPG